MMTTVTTMHWMSILGFALITIGSILTFLGSAKTAEQDKMELSNQIKEKNNTIESIERSNNNLVDLNMKQGEKIVALTDQLQRQTKELQGSVIGEKSRPKCRFSFVEKLKSQAVFHMSNFDGEQPVYQMAGVIVFNNYGFEEQHIRFGPITIPAHSLDGNFWYRFPLDMKAGTKLNISFSTAAGSFHQVICVRMDEQGILRGGSYMIKQNKTDGHYGPIWVEVHPKFPLAQEPYLKRLMERNDILKFLPDEGTL